MRRIVCHARCGNYQELPDTSNVGEVARRTGYHVTFSIGSIIYYCPQCYEKAQELAYGLLIVLKDKYVRLEDFLPRETRKPGTIETTGRHVHRELT